VLRECFFEPTFHKHAGQLCAGVQIHVEDPTHYDHTAFQPWRLQALAFKALRLQAPDYPLWRGVVHRRHTAWRRVLWTMPHRGVLLEFGCGIAPVSAWCARRKPQWTYLLEDLDGPALRYGLWRERRALGHTTAHYFGLVDVLTALDVLEHLPDPAATARDLVERLAPGGYLHWTFPETDGRELDLATAAQRAETIRYLEAALVSVYYDRDGYRVSVKREPTPSPASSLSRACSRDTSGRPAGFLLRQAGVLAGRLEAPPDRHPNSLRAPTGHP